MAAAGTSDVAPGSAPSGVFSRSASGLIRVAGSWDVFIYNVGLVSVGIAIAYNQYYGPSLYPGSDVALSTILATIGMVVAAAAFYMWAVVFPRSGGVYVFLSRATRPGLAFVLTLVETVILLYYAALAASLIVKVGLSSFFATVGSIGHSKTMADWAASVAKPAGVFWIGAALLVIAGLLLASGTRRYFSVQKILFIVAVLGTAVIVLVLLFGSKSTFKHNLHSLTGLDYNSVISTAEKKGWAPHSFSFSETLKFLVWPLLPLLGAVQSVALGGEIKKVRRSQFFGMMGAVMATGLLIALVAVLSSKTFGYDFQGAIGFNSISAVANGSTEGSIGASPYFTVLAGILANNTILAVIIMATFTAWIWFWIPAELAYTTRTMIAWSFDRLAPDKLGYVSQRFHTPVVAIGISTAGALVFMWQIAYKNIALLTMIEVLLLVWGVAMAAAIVFPRTGRSFFERSPASAWRFAGMPLMSVLGTLALAFFGLAFVMLWRDKIAAGPLIDFNHLSTGFWITAVTLILGTAWYIGNKIYRRNQGVQIELAFRQIPIE